MNEELLRYVENNIFPKYKLNDKGHDINHVKYVIKRSLKFAKECENINLNMVYAIAAYHDCGCYIDRSNHEIISAQILSSDDILKKYFKEDEIKIMKEAVEDHRASLTSFPRSIYGKIVASADRRTDLSDIIRSTYEFCIKHCSNDSLEKIIKKSLNHLKEKYDINIGYSKNKMYFNDPEYDEFLRKLNELICDEEMFSKIYRNVNKL